MNHREKSGTGNHSTQAWFRRRYLRTRITACPKPVVACPHCGSENTYVYSSKDLPVRYHKCRACRKCFKSVEKTIKGEIIKANDALHVQPGREAGGL